MKDKRQRKQPTGPSSRNRKRKAQQEDTKSLQDFICYNACTRNPSSLANPSPMASSGKPYQIANYVT